MGMYESTRVKTLSKVYKNQQYCKDLCKCLPPLFKMWQQRNANFHKILTFSDHMSTSHVVNRHFITSTYQKLGFKSLVLHGCKNHLKVVLTLRGELLSGGEFIMSQIYSQFTNYLQYITHMY